jgi:hypothetical protein
MTAHRMITDPNVDPVVILRELTSNSASREPAFYVALFLSSLLVGYLIKAISSKIIEVLSYPLAVFSKQSRHKHWFPYTDYMQQTYPKLFDEVTALFTTVLRTDWHDLPGYQPFEACKQLVKLHVPQFLEEVQEREAQVRMVGSLFLASCVSLVLSLRPGGYWLLISLVTTVSLRALFRRRRHREVSDIYMITVIARQMISAGIQETRETKIDSAQEHYRTRQILQFLTKHFPEQ